MADIFISHVEEDGDIAVPLSESLERAGYTTWCYERHGLPGVGYLDQVGEQIARAKAIVVIISLDSLGSRQVDVEVVRAHEAGLRFIPMLRGISHVEFQARQPRWRTAMGDATSVSVTPDSLTHLVPRLLRGLEALGLARGVCAAPDLASTPVAASPVAADPGAPPDVGAPTHTEEPCAVTSHAPEETPVSATGESAPLRFDGIYSNAVYQLRFYPNGTVRKTHHMDPVGEWGGYERTDDAIRFVVSRLGDRDTEWEGAVVGDHLELAWRALTRDSHSAGREYYGFYPGDD